MTTLEKEYEYFVARQEELSDMYDGKVALIKDESVVDIFDSEFQAYATAIERFEIGTFIIQPLHRDPTAYVQSFHSRVLG